MNEKEEQLGEIILYQPEGSVKLEVRVENETVWLTQAQMAELFQKDRTVIGRHIRNFYKEGELEKSITCANFAHMGADADQIYNSTLYIADRLHEQRQLIERSFVFKKNSPTGKIPQENPCQKNSLSCVLGDVVALEP